VAPVGAPCSCDPSRRVVALLQARCQKPSAQTRAAATKSVPPPPLLVLLCEAGAANRGGAEKKRQLLKRPDVELIEIREKASRYGLLSMACKARLADGCRLWRKATKRPVLKRSALAAARVLRALGSLRSCISCGLTCDMSGI
jgi:hypothetical protein